MFASNREWLVDTIKLLGSILTELMLSCVIIERDFIRIYEILRVDAYRRSVESTILFWKSCSENNVTMLEYGAWSRWLDVFTRFN